MFKKLKSWFKSDKIGCLIILIGDKKTGWIPSNEFVDGLVKTINKSGLQKQFNVLILPSLAVDGVGMDQNKMTASKKAKKLKGVVPVNFIGIDYGSKVDWTAVFKQVTTS